MKNKEIKFAQSRLRRNILSLSAFLLLAAAVWFDKSFHPYLKTYFHNQKTQDGNDWDKYNEKIFTVVKVVDGDTIDINIPDGNWPDTRIRLLGIDTPETEKSPKGARYYGAEASEFAAKMVLGQEVSVIMDKLSKPRDKYHRLLAHIRLADGRILNEELVSQGFAYADTRFPHSYLEKYIQLEKTAIKEKKVCGKKLHPTNCRNGGKNSHPPSP
jgi:micrococcal nuclease